MKHSLGEVRREYDRLDALCGVSTRGVALSVSTRATRRMGLFRPGKPPRIILSAFVLDDDALFWDTIRHEYAHALVWLREPDGRHGHDAVWRAACREVGCDPKATAAPTEEQLALRAERAKYRVVCGSCGQEALYLKEGKIVKLLRAGRGSGLRCRVCGANRFRLEELS